MINILLVTTPSPLFFNNKTEEGKIHTCGLGGGDGRLGQKGNSSTTCQVPTLVDSWGDGEPKFVKQITVGRFHNLFVTGLRPHQSLSFSELTLFWVLDEGQAYAFGYNIAKDLELGEGDIYLPTAIPAFKSIKIKQVATATYHHLFLTG